MRHLLATIAAAGLAATLAGWAFADPPDRNKPRPPLGANPHPVTWGGQRPAKPAAQPVAKPAANRTGEHHHGGSQPYFYGYRVYRPGVIAGFGYPNYSYDPYYGYGYSYDSYGSYGYPYQYPYSYSTPYYNNYYYNPPPIFMPAEQLFGPLAVQRFLGVDNWSRPQARVHVNLPAVGGNANAAPPPPAPKKVSERATNPQANNLAWKFLGYGDALFAEKKYAEASDRYRKASRSAPQLADAWFRQAFAMTAIARYDLAVGAVKRGLTLDDDWPKSEFRLKELFAGDEAAVTEYLDALAKAAELKPTDADLRFMLGVSLHFDSQSDRAQKHLRRAADMLGDDAPHIKAFLRR